VGPSRKGYKKILTKKEALNKGGGPTGKKGKNRVDGNRFLASGVWGRNSFTGRAAAFQGITPDGGRGKKGGGGGLSSGAGTRYRGKPDFIAHRWVPWRLSGGGKLAIQEEGKGAKKRTL